MFYRNIPDLQSFLWKTIEDECSARATALIAAFIEGVAGNILESKSF